MKVVNHFPRRLYLPCYFCLVIALGFASACKTKKIPKAPKSSLPTSGPVQNNGSNVSQPDLPTSGPVQNNGSNVSQPDLAASEPIQNNGSNPSQPNSPTSNKISKGYSGSKKGDQPSIISRLDANVQEEKARCETFSQKLNDITDLSGRDKMIASFVEARNLRIEKFNHDLKTVADPSEKQRLISTFSGVKEICEELNRMNQQYTGKLDPAQQKEKFQKLVMKKWFLCGERDMNGY